MPEALRQLIRRPDAPPTKQQKAAAARIRATWNNDITWELLVKMFNDLDALVFSGDLYHRVCFRWVDMRLTPIGHGELGFAREPRDWNNERICIACLPISNGSNFLATTPSACSCTRCYTLTL